MDGLIVDLFAGGGGASTGMAQAIGRDPDIAINHDRYAIAMYQANHPFTQCYHQDIWHVSPRMATNGHPVALLWASPDCKHFSRAKGAPLQRDVEIRSMAWAVTKWARDVWPAVIILENVEEFLTWGPIDSNGMAIPDRKGEIFRTFVGSLTKCGYKVEWKCLRACDYGAPTIRKRLFMVARRDGQPIVWPETTHGPGKTPYRTAADIIDWSLPCPSIFDRKRPLANNTLKRIARGIQKYVIESQEPFIVTCNHSGGFRGQGINEPFKTITASRDAHGLIIPYIQRQFGNSIGSPMNIPVGTIMADGGGKTAVVTSMISKFHNTNIGQDLREPLHTITAGGQHFAEVRAFMMKYYGEGGQWQRVDEPAHTIPTKDRLSLVTVTINGEPFCITDIGMRMLSPGELFRAQGFRDDYVIDLEVDGKPMTKTNQVRLVGNSVPPQVARAITEANIPSIDISDECEPVDYSDFQLELTCA